VKTVVVNYALDKLKIEITRNSQQAAASFPSGRDLRHCGRFVSGWNHMFPSV